MSDDSAHRIAETLDDSFAARLYQLALQRRAGVSEIDSWSNLITSRSQCRPDAKFAMSFFLNSTGSNPLIPTEKRLVRGMQDRPPLGVAPVGRRVDSQGSSWRRLRR